MDERDPIVNNCLIEFYEGKNPHTNVHIQTNQEKKKYNSLKNWYV